MYICMYEYLSMCCVCYWFLGVWTGFGNYEVMSMIILCLNITKCVALLIEGCGYMWKRFDGKCNLVH